MGEQCLVLDLLATSVLYSVDLQKLVHVNNVQQEKDTYLLMTVEEKFNCSSYFIILALIPLTSIGGTSHSLSLLAVSDAVE